MEGFFSGFKPTWIIPFYHRNKRKIRKSKLHQPTAFLYYMMFKWFINDIYTSKNLKRQYYFSGHFQKTSTSSICKKLGEGKRVFFSKVSIHVDMDGVNPHMPQASKDQSIRFVEAHPKKWQFWWGFEAQSKQTIWWEKCVSDFLAAVFMVGYLCWHTSGSMNNYLSWTNLKTPWKNSIKLRVERKKRRLL